MKNTITALTVILVILSGSLLCAEQPQSVSLIQLIATPEKYNGKFVRVEGYLHYKFEDSALYFTKDHADRLDGRNALWVSYASSETIQLQPKEKDGIKYFDCEWALLEGIFKYESDHGHGHMGMFSGELKNVTRVMKQRQWYDGKKELKR
jgi:hypothetical protein